MLSVSEALESLELHLFQKNLPETNYQGLRKPHNAASCGFLARLTSTLEAPTHPELTTSKVPLR